MTRLRIEQTRLLRWGEQIGLLEDSLEDASATMGFSHNVINDVLLEIQAAFRGCVKIQRKYNPFVEQALPISPEWRIPDTSSKGKLLLERALSLASKPSRATSRLQWAMVKQDVFKNLVDKLIAFNDSMESFLDRDALQEIRALQIQSNMMLLQVTNDVSQLRLLVEAFNIRQPIKHVADGASVSPGLTLQIQSEDITASLARFKADAATVERQTLLKAPFDIDLEEIELESTGLNTGPLVGRYQEHNIWLEWREQVEEDLPSPHIQKTIAERVRQLAALLSNKQKPAIFRSPVCLGYLCDKTDEVPRYAFVYKVDIHPQSRFIGLRTLREAFGVHPMPPLGSRIGLAIALVESLYYLHAVSWLHKGVRSDNVIFVRQRSTQNMENRGEHDDGVDTGSPILSGFDYSRPDLIDEQTFRTGQKVEHDLYRHPDLLQLRTKRSQKSHDIYSLGLVLLEIAMWKPIEHILGIEVRRSRLLEVGQTLAKLGESRNALRLRLAAQVGDEYAAVIELCVNGGERIAPQPARKRVELDAAAQTQDSVLESTLRRLQPLKV